MTNTTVALGMREETFFALQPGAKYALSTSAHSLARLERFLADNTFTGKPIRIYLVLANSQVRRMTLTNLRYDNGDAILQGYIPNGAVDIDVEVRIVAGGGGEITVSNL